LALYTNPHILFVEDDSIIVTQHQSLERLLAESVRLMDDPDVMSVRVMRPGDWPPSGEHGDHNQLTFKHSHINFQPLILRSHQFYSMLKAAEDNIEEASRYQIEMLWRIILSPYSRSKLPHIVWNRDHAHTVHLGTPEYPALCAALNLT
jgi:hypothetical protein